MEYVFKISCVKGKPGFEAAHVFRIAESERWREEFLFVPSALLGQAVLHSCSGGLLFRREGRCVKGVHVEIFGADEGRWRCFSLFGPFLPYVAPFAKADPFGPLCGGERTSMVGHRLLSLGDVGNRFVCKWRGKEGGRARSLSLGCSFLARTFFVGIVLEWLFFGRAVYSKTSGIYRKFLVCKEFSVREH